MLDTRTFTHCSGGQELILEFPADDKVRVVVGRSTGVKIWKEVLDLSERQNPVTQGPFNVRFVLVRFVHPVPEYLQGPAVLLADGDAKALPVRLNLLQINGIDAPEHAELFIDGIIFIRQLHVVLERVLPPGRWVKFRKFELEK